MHILRQNMINFASFFFEGLQFLNAKSYQTNPKWNKATCFENHLAWISIHEGLWWSFHGIPRIFFWELVQRFLRANWNEVWLRVLPIDCDSSWPSFNINSGFFFVDDRFFFKVVKWSCIKDFFTNPSTPNTLNCIPAMHYVELHSVPITFRDDFE